MEDGAHATANSTAAAKPMAFKDVGIRAESADVDYSNSRVFEPARQTRRGRRRDPDGEQVPRHVGRGRRPGVVADHQGRSSGSAKTTSVETEKLGRRSEWSGSGHQRPAGLRPAADLVGDRVTTGGCTASRSASSRDVPLGTSAFGRGVVDDLGVRQIGGTSRAAAWAIAAVREKLPDEITPTRRARAAASIAA